MHDHTAGLELGLRQRQLAASGLAAHPAAASANHRVHYDPAGGDVDVRPGDRQLAAAGLFVHERLHDNPAGTDLDV
jgi:hypothetical protein